MRILALEPFGPRAVARGSHASHLEGWQTHSTHAFRVLALPGLHWKWRSRHAAVTFAEQSKELAKAGEKFDCVFCSEMLNVAEWKGLAHTAYAELPVVTYFHENQLTYPLPANQRRDYHLAYGNVVTALASDALWFNSQFHLDEFAEAADLYLARMPDFGHRELLRGKLLQAHVMPPGISVPSEPKKNSSDTAKPLRIGWVARWEHDKRPDQFLQLVEQLLDKETNFELILLGQQFESSTEYLDKLKSIAAGKILHEGHAATKAEYWSWLRQMDVLVSTADHEFFGIGVLEAMAARAVPLLPNKLAYPEVLTACMLPTGEASPEQGSLSDYLYETPTQLVQRIENYAANRILLSAMADRLTVSDFHWERLAKKYDAQIAQICERGRSA